QRSRTEVDHERIPNQLIGWHEMLGFQVEPEVSFGLFPVEGRAHSHGFGQFMMADEADAGLFEGDVAVDVVRMDMGVDDIADRGRGDGLYGFFERTALFR